MKVWILRAERAGFAPLQTSAQVISSPGGDAIGLSPATA